MLEEKHGITVLFYDRPNMEFIEEQVLGRKINHNEFFTFLAKDEEELHVRFYWQSNEDESPFGTHLNRLRKKLQPKGIQFTSIETDKDVDIDILNDMITALFDSSVIPKKIILCSGDKAFSIILGTAKRRLDIPTTVISGKNHCAEVLKDVLYKTIFVEDIVSDNENLLFDSSHSIE